MYSQRKQFKPLVWSIYIYKISIKIKM